MENIRILQENNTDTARAFEFLRCIREKQFLKAEILVSELETKEISATLRNLDKLWKSSEEQEKINQIVKNNLKNRKKQVDSLLEERNSLLKMQKSLDEGIIAASLVELGVSENISHKHEESLRKSRIFETKAELLLECASSVNVEDLHSPYLLAPFPHFAIFLDMPLSYQEIIKDKDVTIETIWVDATKNEWLCYAKISVDDIKLTVGCGLDTEEGTLTAKPNKSIKERMKSHGVYHQYKKEHSKKYGTEDDQVIDEIQEASIDTEEVVKLQGLAPLIVGFCLLLNSQNTIITPAPGSKINIADKDIDGDGPRRQRPRYRITVTKGDITRQIRQTLQGKSTLLRRPHWVRKHARTLENGMVVSVRRHTRCGNPGSYLPIYEVRHRS